MGSARRRFVAVFAAALPLVLVANPATAATVSKTSSCSTASASVVAHFGVDNDATPYGTLRWAQGVGEGAFTNTPALTVRVRDGYGRLIVTKRSGDDGSMSVAFSRRIGGPNWTAEATFDTTAPTACTAPKVRIAVS